MQKKVSKGTRLLLIKNPENLNRDRQEAERLALAHYLKEDLPPSWEQPNKAKAAAFLRGLDCQSPNLRHSLPPAFL